ncbi:hypothetical protein [Anaerohalosphaera lusitana]|uniref:hypothetical protein n=1 Tax=Anaerohalosphaera lusitana TaxID=1936003 RepID=UPI0011BABA91|nr:hypothetical protein [Anaerohalosphaera lusitana]
MPKLEQKKLFVVLTGSGAETLKVFQQSWKLLKLERERLFVMLRGSNAGTATGAVSLTNRLLKSAL